MFVLFLWGLFYAYHCAMEIAFLNGRKKVARVLRRAGGELSIDFIKRLSVDERNASGSFGT